MSARWTPDQDAVLLALLQKGLPSPRIAARLGRTIAAIERWRAVLRAKPACPQPSHFLPPPRAAGVTLKRIRAGDEPLPPGHPLSWEPLLAMVRA